jgi:hypothetical protein
MQLHFTVGRREGPLQQPGSESATAWG